MGSVRFLFRSVLFLSCSLLYDTGFASVSHISATRRAMILERTTAHTLSRTPLFFSATVPFAGPFDAGLSVLCA